MKKLFLSLLMATFAFAMHAQKFALVDMDYILRNLPAYEIANEQLTQTSQKWEQEVNKLTQQAERLYNNYQSEMVFLNDGAKKKREEEIVAKEKEATDLRYKYFGPEGELFKKRQALMQPIQDDVYNAVKAVAEEGGYQAIFDRASSQAIVFASPKIDVSNLVLQKLGLAK